VTSVSCVSVCWSVGLAYFKNHMSKFHKIFCTCHVAVALAFSDNKVIPTSGFVDDIMLSCDRQIQAWSLQHSELFTMICQAVLLNCAPGAKFAIADFLVGI